MRGEEIKSELIKIKIYFRKNILFRIRRRERKGIFATTTIRDVHRSVSPRSCQPRVPIIVWSTFPELWSGIPRSYDLWRERCQKWRQRVVTENACHEIKPMEFPVGDDIPLLRLLSSRNGLKLAFLLSLSSFSSRWWPVNLVEINEGWGKHRLEKTVEQLKSEVNSERRRNLMDIFCSFSSYDIIR